jgi:hypothetical protein
MTADHPEGASKASFFEAHGFRRDDWQELAAALRTRLPSSRGGRRTVAVRSRSMRWTAPSVPLTAGRPWSAPSGSWTPALNSRAGHRLPIGCMSNPMIREHDRVVLTAPIPSGDWKRATSGPWSTSIRPPRPSGGVRHLGRLHRRGGHHRHRKGPSGHKDRDPACAGVGNSLIGLGPWRSRSGTRL